MIKELKAYLAQSEEKNYSEGLRLYAKLPNRDDMKLYRFSRNAVQEKIDAELQRQLEKLEYAEKAGKYIPTSAPAPGPVLVEEPAKQDDLEKLAEEVKDILSLSEKEVTEIQYLHNQVAKLSNSLMDAPSDGARKIILEEIRILEDRKKAIQAPEAEPQGELPRAAELPKLIANTRSRISKLKGKIAKKATAELQSELAKEEANLTALKIELDGLKQ